MRLYGNKINISKLFWGTMFLLLALPLHASNNLLAYISITTTITLFHVVLFIIACFVFIINKGKITVNMRMFYLLMLFIFLLLATGIGIKNGYGINSVLGDAGMYFLLFFIVYIVSSKQIIYKNLYELLDFVSKAMTVSCTLSLIMFLTRGFAFWGMTSYNGGRYFGGYLSILGIILPYWIYEYLYLENKKLILLLYRCIVGGVCICIAQSRTVIFIIGLGIILVILFDGKKITTRILLKKLILTIIIAFGMVMLLNSGLQIISRILSMNLKDQAETSFARLYLYKYYWPQINLHRMGVGFGKILYFVNEDLSLQHSTATFTVDSSLMTIGYKGGMILLVIEVIGYILPSICLLKVFIKKKDGLYVIMSILYGAFIFSTAIITGQTIHTYAVVGFLGLVIGLCLKKVSKDMVKSVYV